MVVWTCFKHDLLPVYWDCWACQNSGQLDFLEWVLATSRLWSQILNFQWTESSVSMCWNLRPPDTITIHHFQIFSAVSIKTIKNSQEQDESMHPINLCFFVPLFRTFLPNQIQIHSLRPNPGEGGAPVLSLDGQRDVARELGPEVSADGRRWQSRGGFAGVFYRWWDQHRPKWNHFPMLPMLILGHK